MPFTTSCPSCGSALRLADEYAGGEARCGRCGAVFAAAPTSEPPPLPRPDLDDWDDRPRRSRPAGDTSGMAVTGLVLGIIAALSWPCPPAGLVTGGIAVVAGGMGLQSRSRSYGVVGIVLGLVGVIFSLGCGVLYGVAIYQEQKANEFGPDGNRPPFVGGAD